MNLLLNVKQVVERLKQSNIPATIYKVRRFISAGNLPAVRTSQGFMISQIDLQNFIDTFYDTPAGTLLPVDEVYRRLRLEGIVNTKNTVRRWIRDGRIPAILLDKKEGYRVLETDLDSFIHACHDISDSIYLGGIDWLEFSLDFADYDSIASELLDSLEQHKIMAQDEERRDLVFFDFVNKEGISFSDGYYRFEVLPAGSRMYAYILDHEDLQVKLARYRSKNEENFPVSVRIKSQYLWREPYTAILDHVISCFSRFFGRPINSKLSRIDLCCHTDALHFTVHSAQTFVCRAHVGDIRFAHGEVSAVDFGSIKSPLIYGRVYNKHIEMTKKRDKTWFIDVWKKNGWTGQRMVWNVEFQIKRDGLRSLGLDNLGDLSPDKLKETWNYLVCNWLRWIEDEPNVPVSQRPTRKAWWNLTQGFASSGFERATRQEQQASREDLLFPVFVGLVTSIASRTQQTDVHKAFEQFKVKTLDHLYEKQTNFEESVLQKMQKQVSQPELDSYEGKI